MKKIKKFLLPVILMLLIVPLCVVLGGCDTNTIGIASIEKTATNGNVDTYTITYTNGTTSTFEIKNGVNGEDGRDGEDALSITLDELFEKYKEENPTATYMDFLREYSNFGIDSSVVINDCLLSSMKVYSEFTETSSSGFYSVSKSVAVYGGSAVIYKMESDYTYIITNYHVIYDEKANADNGTGANQFMPRKMFGYVYGSESFYTHAVDDANKQIVDEKGYDVYDYGKTAIPLEVVGGSATYDIAIVKASTQDILDKSPSAKAVKFATEYHVGETAIAIGNANGDGISATTGIVSVENENINLSVGGETRSYRSIRIETPIYHGNSGGGLFNANGELIGITNSGTETYEAVNYAIPLNIVKNAASNIMYYYKDGESSTNGVYKIKLGVTVTNENPTNCYNNNTGYGTLKADITVAAVEAGSLFDDWSIEVGDVLKSMFINDEEKVCNLMHDIGDLLISVKPGDNIKFKYTRDGEEHTTIIHTILNSELIAVE